MKEWIRKTLAIIVIFSGVYFALFNIINIDESANVQNNAKIVTHADKKLAVAALSVIGTSVILEVITIIMFINKTVSPESFKLNLIKLILLTITFIIVCGLSYYIYLAKSITRIVYV